MSLNSPRLRRIRAPYVEGADYKELGKKLWKDEFGIRPYDNEVTITLQLSLFDEPAIVEVAGYT
jgi:hypothetical protein